MIIVVITADCGNYRSALESEQKGICKKKGGEAKAVCSTAVVAKSKNFVAS